MSEYADIFIRKLSLHSFRNYLDGDIISLFFSNNDLVITQEDKQDSEKDNFIEDTTHFYKTTVQKAKERFDARGYGINNFEKIFNINILQGIDYSAFLRHLNIDPDEYEKESRERIEKKVTFKKWKNAMNKIITYELKNGNIEWYETNSEIDINTECEKVIYYSLKEDNTQSFYALYPEIIQTAYIFRLILESCANDDEIVLDFSNLIGWTEDYIPKAISEVDNVEKIIVLVEGSSDKDILEFSMQKIYPHLSDLFYFMEFEDAGGRKRDGGASYVVKNLKTFYFSKIKSKFIAIFDNDAEGYQSKITLLNSIKSWPNNFRILLYPEIDLFHSYPTLAPNGKIITDDINRKAASIELYLPDDIIKENGEFYPIEWEARKKIKFVDGKEEALYQGVISQKEDIKKNFQKLRNSIINDEKYFAVEDWIRMKQLLDIIIFAFDKG